MLQEEAKTASDQASSLNLRLTQNASRLVQSDLVLLANLFCG